MIVKNTEYVLKGHPDRLADGVAETIAMAIYNLDGWEGRSAVEILYTGNKFVVGGEFMTSLCNADFEKVIEFIVKKIVSKQTQEFVYVSHLWQQQSPEIHEASLEGLGDNTIAYGYYNFATGQNKTPSHLKLKELARKITLEHVKHLPDGKLINFDNGITISIEEGICEDKLLDMGLTVPTIFKKSGANADSGVVGRKLIAERHGNGIPHGGGAFAGKDFTKGDKSLKLIAGSLAHDHNDLTQDKYNYIQLSCKYGSNMINVVADSGEEWTESFTDWIDKLEWLYRSYAPVRPWDFLTGEEIQELELLLVKLSGRDKLKHNLW